jgi:hypothetical protein
VPARLLQVIAFPCRSFSFHGGNTGSNPSGTPNSGSNKGHDVCYLQYRSVPVGRHLLRKVVGFAASHEAVNRRVVGSSPT